MERAVASGFVESDVPGGKHFRSLTSLRIGLWMSLLAAAAISSTAQGGPHVEFDISYMVGCLDVTPPEFAAVNPGERLVEARFQVSTFIGSGDPDDLIQYLYRVQSPRRSVEIVDYQPKTAMESRYAGNVGIENKSETSRSLGLNIGAHDEHVLPINGTLGGDLAVKTSGSVRYELLPPLELVAASGTMHRGSGAYFKLKPSGRTSLEGAKEFVLVLRVPNHWQGDYMHIRCEATGPERSLLSGGDQKSCGRADFMVALYQSGSETAKQAAERFANAESSLRYLAKQRDEEIDQLRYPTLAHRVGAMLDVYDPAVDSIWLEKLLFGPPDANAVALTSHLPGPVQKRAKAYLAAKRHLGALSVSRPETSSQH